MAYVAPNGTIQLFRGIGLTNEYVHTIWFPNKSTQDSVFTQLVRYQFANQMYSRPNKNSVRVNIVADVIQDCDYMRFQNTRNGISKWYYCFINEINYVNEQVTDIVYEIDDIQTWSFDGNFQKCFVERQHSLTDNIGDNIVPEPFEIPESIVCYTGVSYKATGVNYMVVLGATKLAAGFNDLDQTEYGGFASTVHYLLFDSSNLHTFIKNCEFANGFISGLFNTDDQWSILAIYAVPAPLFNDGTSKTIKGATGKVLAQYAYARYNTITKPSSETASHGNIYDGVYGALNMKLYTYPYYFLKISTPTGEQDLKYENFFNSNVHDCVFSVKTGCNPEPQILIAPHYYNGEDFDNLYSVIVSGFPAMTIYQSTQTGAIIGSALKTGIGLLTAASIGAAGESGVGVILGQGLAKQGNAGVNAPPALQGTVSISGKNTSGNMSPYFASSGLPTTVDPIFEINIFGMGLRAQVARMFDEYLSKYGYAQNRVMKPETHARQKWTYVKTKDCSFVGTCPSDSAKRINTAMNNGITWWDYRTSVGNYGTFSNPVL